MTLRLRNTLGRRIEPVEPLEPGRVRMYTCGPTVYRYAHVGNLRSNLLADLIRRVLLYHGNDVFQVKNITDVGHLRDEGFDRGADPMLVAAGLEHKTPGEIADAYEAAFHADEALVNILPAHVFPRATDHIPEMLALAEALEDAGYAYATADGNVYYDVGRFEGYGQLSGNTLADLRAASFTDSKAGAGLDSPVLSVKVKFDEGKKEEQVAFGKAGDASYAATVDPGAAKLEGNRLDEIFKTLDELAK